MGKLYESYPPLFRMDNIRVMDIPEVKERNKGAESLFKEIISENFLKLRKELDIQVHEAKKTPNYLNAKKPSPRDITLKLSEVNDKERILKEARGKSGDLQRNLQ